MLAIVPAVTGAPGDGNKSLTAAIQRELAVKGISIAEDKPIKGNKPTKGAYRIECSVTVGEAKDGKQPIHIEWLVRNPQGKKLGTVSQINEIPAGSLDGAWEGTADQAAGAAAQGIVKLFSLNQSSSSQPNLAAMSENHSTPRPGPPQMEPSSDTVRALKMAGLIIALLSMVTVAVFVISGLYS